MLSVIICEDDPKQRKRIETIVLEHAASKDYEMNLAFSTYNPVEVLAYLEKNPLKNGLYILDVDLGHNMNGIALAAEIREKDLRGTIVFITTHAELTYLIFQFKVEAMDYIIKDALGNFRTQIEACIDVAYQRHLQGNIPKEGEVYQCKVGSQIRNIPFRDILFFESHTTPGKIILRTKNTRFEHYGALRDVEHLGPTFFRCHQSFVVNLKNIELVDKSTYEVRMEGGSRIFVASRKMTELLRRMSE